MELEDLVLASTSKGVSDLSLLQQYKRCCSMDMVGTGLASIPAWSNYRFLQQFHMSFRSMGTVDLDSAATSTWSNYCS
jgi:hypothetical protein